MSGAAGALLRRAGLPDVAPRALAGGDISSVSRCGDVVVKTRVGAPSDFFETEARGLRALAEAGVRVPAVHYADRDGIVIEYLPPGRDDWAGLAEQLAALHSRRSEAPWGSEHRVYIGSCPIPAMTTSDWGDLWWQGRIAPLVRQCGSLLSGRKGALSELADRVSLPVEGPVLIHGDLWSGNVHMSEGGAALIDPSCWIGERGVDIAMMELFGGFPRSFWQAYEAGLPIGDELRRALPAYRLYFVLAHVAMFGSGYLGSVDRILEEL